MQKKCNCSPFITCASFHVVFICYRVLSQTYIVQCVFLQLLFSPFSNLHFSIPCFCNCHLCLSQTCIVQSHFFFAIVLFDFLKLAFFISIFLQLSFLPFFELHVSIPLFALFLHFFQAENILEQAQFDSTSLATASFVATGEPPPDTRFCGRRCSPFWLQTYTLRLHLFSSKTAENFQSVAACLASIKHHLGQYGRRVS